MLILGGVWESFSMKCYGGIISCGHILHLSVKSCMCLMPHEELSCMSAGALSFKAIKSIGWFPWSGTNGTWGDPLTKYRLCWCNQTHKHCPYTFKICYIWFVFPFQKAYQRLSSVQHRHLSCCFLYLISFQQHFGWDHIIRKECGRDLASNQPMKYHPGNCLSTPSQLKAIPEH